MVNKNPSEQKVYEAEVIDSSVVDEGVLRNVLIRAGRTLAKPALEAFEILISPSTPPKVKVSMVAALTYLIMPLDVIPDFIPVAGFSDDLVALTAVISLWQNYVTPEIRNRALRKLDKWLPL
tara:strand:- start:936 stop:1301 length:366 start_codon:yes stop_codon:yes gene_type:complete